MEESVNPINSISSKYVREFESLFVSIRVNELYNKARHGQLRNCQFRSICWRFFLRCLPKQNDQWLEACKNGRKEYDQITSKHLHKRQTKDDNQGFQPGSENVQSHGTKDKVESALTAAKITEFEEEQRYLKATNECDHKNVFRTIQRDVVRTFPDMEFFRQTEVQSILENVLFNFASENPHLSYKQGMHELLAILLYVLHTDSRNCLISHEGGYANETIAFLLDLKYLEHDVFHLFCALMKSIETWYQNDEIVMVPNRHARHNHGQLAARSSRQQVSSFLGNKLNMISEKIVKSYDRELFNHLEALQIAPQIYGIRWMRLLFGREFEFLDLLTVWDALICDQKAMSLTEYVFASMLLTIREKLVNGDYTDCLNNLMRHQFKDVQYVIKLALYLREPKIYPRPGLPKSSKLIGSIANPIKAHHSKQALNLSTESYDDLHSIVDYCWRLLSEQIDSLQRCLPKEKGLHSEDEIFVALAQLKKVRDVLKGSLRLEDELDSPSGRS